MNLASYFLPLGRIADSLERIASCMERQELGGRTKTPGLLTLYKQTIHGDDDSYVGEVDDAAIAAYEERLIKNMEDGGKPLSWGDELPKP